MSKTWIIARKEFVDLYSNPMMIVVLSAYLIFILYQVYAFGIALHSSSSGVQSMLGYNWGMIAASSVLNTLTMVSALVGLIIGSSIISTERTGHSIDTLMAKPVYRDVIINGKMIAAMAFLISVQIFVILLYSSGFLILYGNALSGYISDYVTRLPFILLIATAYVWVFLSISMLMSVLIRDQAFAMIISLLSYYVSNIMWNANVALNIDKIFPGNGLGALCVNLSPTGTLVQIQTHFFDISGSAFNGFQQSLPDMFKFVIYAIIFIVFSYAIFIRRDIS